MLGTNHTRKGEKAVDIMEKLKTSKDALTAMNDNHIYFVQTPPLAHPVNIRDIIQNNILNATLPEMKSDRTEIIETQIAFENIPKQMTTKPDGFHVSQLGATIISEQIAEHIKYTSNTKRIHPSTKPTQLTKTPKGTHTATKEHTHQPTDHTRQPTDHTRQPNEHTRQHNDNTHQPNDHTLQPNDHTRQPNDHTRQDIDHIHQPNEHTRQRKVYTTQAAEHTSQAPTQQNTSDT